MPKVINSEKVRVFEVAKDKLKKFYEEFVKLSNKKPDGAVNKFKLMHLNSVVKEINQLITKEYVPFSDFSEFEEDQVPTNSDVVMILSQYLSQMARFRNDHSKSVGYSGSFWYTEEYQKRELAATADEEDEEDWDDD